MPAELITFLISTLPVLELRAGLPWGLAFGGLTPFSAFFWSTAGTTLATIAVIYLLDPVIKFIRSRSKPLDRFIEKIFKKTRHKHSNDFNRFGALFLVVLVAIPIPGSGGYTGALVSYLFGVPPRPAALLVGTGVILSGFVMLAIVTGGLEVFEFLQPTPHLPGVVEGLVELSQ